LNTAVAAAAAQATLDTAKAKAKTPPTVKRNVWGSYVDELVSYTVKKPRKIATRYYAHANNLYSIAATTNASGQVVERYSYNAYGVQTVRNSANAVISKSAVGQDRGFTSYKLDGETGLYFARARMYSVKLGRFIGRDAGPSLDDEYLLRRNGFNFSESDEDHIDDVLETPEVGWGYYDGFNAYSANFIPNAVDPFGTVTCHIYVFLHADRGRAGRLVVQDANRRPIWRTPVRGQGTGGNAMNHNGDTPIGDYSAAIMNARGRGPDSSYGAHRRVALTPLRGPALAAARAGRTDLRIHGGRMNRGTPSRPCNTNGCLRVWEPEMEILIDTMETCPGCTAWIVHVFEGP
jgi:RHS repeat-associated protein